MKSRKAKDLRSLNDVELGTFVAEAEETLVKFRFQKALSQLHNTAAIKIIRKDLARMKTLQHERKTKS